MFRDIFNYYYFKRMTCPVKILWINQRDDTPIDGLGQIDNRKIWFSRIKNDRYDLYTLNEEAIKEIEIEHEILCNKLGLPLYHGDPYKMEFKPSENNIKVYERIINPKLIDSQYLMTIDKSHFSNYLVPHQIIF